MPVGNVSAEQISSNYEKYKDYFAESSDTEMGVDAFINLLVAEISNQDPLEPMSNTEFVSQMATFTNLRVMQNVEYYSTANYASSLVGKNLTISSIGNSGAVETTTGVCMGMVPDGKSFYVMVNGKKYSLTNVMEVAPMIYGSNGSSDTEKTENEIED